MKKRVSPGAGRAIILMHARSVSRLETAFGRCDRRRLANSVRDLGRGDREQLRNSRFRSLGGHAGCARAKMGTDLTSKNGRVAASFIFLRFLEGPILHKSHAISVGPRCSHQTSRSGLGTSEVVAHSITSEACPCSVVCRNDSGQVIIVCRRTGKLRPAEGSAEIGGRATRRRRVAAQSGPVLAARPDRDQSTLSFDVR